MKWKFCKTAFVSLKLQLEKNVYLISDILVCGITEYFMKLSGIFWSSLKQAKIKTTSCFTVQNNQLSKQRWHLYSIRMLSAHYLYSWIINSGK